MRSSHSLDRLDTAFDDDRLVADVGLLCRPPWPSIWAFASWVDTHLDLGDKPGRAHVGDKLLALVMSALAGGDCIDDADALRAGGHGPGARLHGQGRPRPWAPTCGASAGAMSASSMRLSRELLGRAWASGAGPGTDPFTIDLDSAPVPVWSGNIVRHRLNRGGNRQLNLALHRIAITQLRVPGPGRDYVLHRMAAGDTKTEAIRALRRRISDEVFRRMTIDQATLDARDAPSAAAD